LERAPEPDCRARCLITYDVRRALATLVVAFSAVTSLRSAQDSPQPASPPIRFRAVFVEGPRTVAALRKELGPDGFSLLLKINRLDLEHVRQGDTLAVPEAIGDAAALSPFPRELPAELAAAPRMIVVSRRVQAFAAYENGTLVRWGPTSTGRKETPTPAGLYHTNWRSKLRRSSDNPQWLLPWLVNFENSRGISFHQFDLPGYPASHACVRLLEEDARWIFEFADSWTLSDDRRSILIYGTPVIVFGDYAYDAPPPWKQLPADPTAASVDLTELRAALEPHIAVIAERARQRAAVGAVRF
jgi:hypothetical protein